MLLLADNQGINSEEIHIIHMLYSKQALFTTVKLIQLARSQIHHAFTYRRDFLRQRGETHHGGSYLSRCWCGVDKCSAQKAMWHISKAGSTMKQFLIRVNNAGCLLLFNCSEWWEHFF